MASSRIISTVTRIYKVQYHMSIQGVFSSFTNVQGEAMRAVLLFFRIELKSHEWNGIQMYQIFQPTEVVKNKIEDYAMEGISL